MKMIKTLSRHGGARPGAGRPPKSMRFADVRALVDERIAAALPDITDTLIAAAKAGDLGAARYLHDRILGRTALMEVAPADAEDPYIDADIDALLQELQAQPG
ncbi:MAG: hypothetical protein NT029_01240 [Armatimonadetes bacterium]|nr:hypothetical protein [Armatimonadota bacterium]